MFYYGVVGELHIRNQSTAVIVKDDGTCILKRCEMTKIRVKEIWNNLAKSVRLKSLNEVEICLPLRGLIVFSKLEYWPNYQKRPITVRW